MNLILLFPEDYCGDHRVRLEGRRRDHIQKVQRAELGAELRVGLVDGQLGLGRVTRLDETAVELEVELNAPPPLALPLTLVLGLPRPKMLKRTLQTIAAMGVKDVYLLGSYRVEKSFWQTALLEPERIREQLVLGLEQAIDTAMPRVHLRKLFKPFAEDELPGLAANTRAVVAHPYDAAAMPAPSMEPTTLAVGPEGGFIEYEIGKLRDAGLMPVHLGPRVLRVEAAVPVLLARLFPVVP